MGRSGYTDEQWQKHVEFLEKTLQQLRDDNVDSRTLCVGAETRCGAAVAGGTARRIQPRQLSTPIDQAREWPETCVRVVHEGSRRWFIRAP
jgi:hypothetical protein